MLISYAQILFNFVEFLRLSSHKFISFISKDQFTFFSFSNLMPFGSFRDNFSLSSLTLAVWFHMHAVVSLCFQQWVLCFYHGMVLDFAFLTSVEMIKFPPSVFNTVQGIDWFLVSNFLFFTEINTTLSWCIMAIMHCWIPGVHVVFCGKLGRYQWETLMFTFLLLGVLFGFGTKTM